MLGYFKYSFAFFFTLCIFAFYDNSYPKVTLGAYYFDGWTGVYSNHITKKLVDSFPEREPKWGWITSSQQIVNEQIIEAANSGLSFFSFCWYLDAKKNPKKEPLNNALRYFQNSPYKNKLQFCIMVANHQGYEIEKNDWDLVCKEWLEVFSDKRYLKVEGKPLLTFFSLNSLINQFGSVDEVKIALDNLRALSTASGFKGVSIAICLNNPRVEIEKAEKCGFDIITGYNYHSAGFKGKNQQIPIDSLIVSERRVWDSFANLSKLKYIPVSTLNWDPRPWADNRNNYSNASYYVGFSPESVFKSVKSCIDWIKDNPERTPIEKLAILYAWNENGEGAYLTPSKNKVKMGKYIKRATIIK